MDLVEVIDLIMQGVDPSTGEVFDTDMLKSGEIKDSIDQLYAFSNQPLKKPSPSLNALRERVKGARTLSYERWSTEEDEALKLEYEANMSIRHIAEKHQRSDGAIRERLIKNGLLDAPSYWNRDLRENTSEKIENKQKQLPSKEIPQRNNNESGEFPFNLLSVVFKKDVSSLPEFPNNVCERLCSILDCFGDRSKQIMLMRFQDNRTLRQIGDEFQLSHERIRQIINKNIRRLQHPSRKKLLLDSSIPIIKKPSHDQDE